MTASQPTQRRTAILWRAVRRGGAALRTIHDEQVLPICPVLSLVGGQLSGAAG